MKLNGLSRVLIPIQANTKFVSLLKDIYDTREKEQTLDIASFINHYEEANEQC